MLFILDFPGLLHPPRMWAKVMLVGKDICNLWTSKFIRRWEGREKIQALFQLRPRPPCSKWPYYCLLFFSNIHHKIAEIWFKDVSTTDSAGNQSTRCPFSQAQDGLLRNILKAALPYKEQQATHNASHDPSQWAQAVWPLCQQKTEILTMVLGIV